MTLACRPGRLRIRTLLVLGGAFSLIAFCSAAPNESAVPETSHPDTAKTFVSQPAHGLGFGDGALFIARERRIWRCQPDGTLSVFADLTATGEKTPWLWALAWHDDQLYAAAHDRIVRIDRSGVVSTFVAEKFSGPCGVTDLVFDARDALYATYDNYVARYTPDGTKQIVLDGARSTEPQIRWLTSLRIDHSGRFWLSDVRSRRVLVAELDARGLLAIKRIYQLPEHPEYLAVAPDGKVYVGFPDAGTLARLDEDGSHEMLLPKGAIDFPVSMEFGSAGFDRDALFVAGRSGIATVPLRSRADPSAKARALLDRIDWLHHRASADSASVRIRSTRTIYVDPVDLPVDPAAPKADLILLTHPHGDHLDPATLARLRQSATRIVTVRNVAEKLGADWNPIVIAPGESTLVDGVAIDAVVAYNPDGGVHHRSAGWAGYVLTLDGVRIYCSGDTSLTPEMLALAGIDIALLNGHAPYQMSGAEMVQAAAAIKPRFLVPIHWQETDRVDIDLLRADAPLGSEVVLLAQR